MRFQLSVSATAAGPGKSVRSLNKDQARFASQQKLPAMPSNPTDGVA
jgi:hypothetical protein